MGLNINHLSKQFGDFTAVDDLNFTVQEGDMYGLLGGNGAGKTTTFRMILNILKPTSGSVTFNDKKSITTLQTTLDICLKSVDYIRN